MEGRREAAEANILLAENKFETHRIMAWSAANGGLRDGGLSKSQDI